MEVKQQLLREAEQFIYTCYEELGRSRNEAEARLLDIRHDIDTTGTYGGIHRCVPLYGLARSDDSF